MFSVEDLSKADLDGIDFQELYVDFHTNFDNAKTFIKNLKDSVERMDLLDSKKEILDDLCEEATFVS